MTLNIRKIRQNKLQAKKIYFPASLKERKGHTIWEQLESLYLPNVEGSIEIIKESKDFFDSLLNIFFEEPKEKCVYCGTSNPKYYENCKNCLAAIKGGNIDKITFSSNFWDYLDDLEYMPSLQDRIIIESKPRDEKYGSRVKIWDYFFRINNDDLGQPQKYCIKLLKDYSATLTAIFEEIKQQDGKTKQYYIKKREQNVSKLENLLFRLQPTVLDLDDIKINRANLDSIIKQIEKVIQELQKSIVHLQTEANKVIRPSDAEIRNWLESDLKQVKQKSLEKMRLGSELETTEFKLSKETNPFTFTGPAQLQDLAKIPKPYQPYPRRQIDEDVSLLQVLPIQDKAKHLLARRIIDTQKSKEITFAVYHIEHIAVGVKLLAQNSYFYDFISGQVVGESVAEYYYQDIVSIQLNHEFRRVPIDYSEKKYIEIEDAPVFRINFTNGHSHSVTFLNEAVKQQLYLFVDSKVIQNKTTIFNLRSIEKVSESEENQFMETASVLRQNLRLFKQLRKLVEFQNTH